MQTYEDVPRVKNSGRASIAEMTPVGFEPTQLALVELESTPLDHSGKVSLSCCCGKVFLLSIILLSTAIAQSSIHEESDAQ